MNYKKRLEKTISYLKKKKKVLILTTSNRWVGNKEDPKSTIIAKEIAKKLGKKATIIDVTKLNIYPCEGNVSTSKGNNCGVKGAVLKDKNKNPSGCHRCWASINNRDDELWKISKPLLESEAVLFVGSVRWGQMNAIYQKLIERLTWLENRHSTLEEDNIIKRIDAGLICVGQNWRGAKIIKIQKKVLNWFGFTTPKELFWNWQYTKDAEDETQESYKKSHAKFMNDFGLKD